MSCTRNEPRSNDHCTRPYKRRPEVPGSVRTPSGTRPARTRKPAPPQTPRSSDGASRRRWSPAQENLAIIYRAMGMNPDQIAEKLGVSRYLVTQILLDATARGKR